MASSGPHLVDELESTFQVCLSALTKQEHVGGNDPEEIKISVEQSIQKFLDSAKQLEASFLQKRLVLSVHKPEQIINEDITELKQELQRKEMLIQKHQDKLQQWQSMLSRTGSSNQTTTIGQQGPSTTTPSQTSQQASQLPQMVSQSHSTPQTPPVSQPMPPPQAAHPQYPQGPLAFLEQTTSSIGMPDGRR